MLTEMVKKWQTAPEGQTFDRKSARITAKNLANTIIAMANADGGEIVVGIEDDGSISGVKKFSKNASLDFSGF